MPRVILLLLSVLGFYRKCCVALDLGPSGAAARPGKSPWLRLQRAAMRKGPVAKSIRRWRSTIRRAFHLHPKKMGVRIQSLAAEEARMDPTTVTDGGGAEIPLWPAETAPPFEDTWPQRTEIFVKADLDDPVAKSCCPGDTKGFWFYNVSKPSMVPFIVPPGTPGRKDAAVIIAPGGGMQFLAWHKEGTYVAKWLNTIGISAFVLKYRLNSRAKEVKPADPLTEAAKGIFGALFGTGKTKLQSLVDREEDIHLADAQRAVSMVRRDAKEKYGLNENRIGFMGFSAGGHLTSEVSYNIVRAYPKVDTVDDVRHQPDFALIIYGSGKKEMAKFAPATFLATASDDQCVHASGVYEYHQALRGNGKPSEIHVFPEGRHGYGECSLYVETGDWKSVCAWVANAEQFIDTVVLQPDVAKREDINQKTYPMKNLGGRKFGPHGADTLGKGK